MPDRRGTRFLVEVVFLAALAAVLAFAHLTTLEIVGMMALGWVVVAGVEWAAWRGEPHYGSGLPPRYYVPGVRLPPPQPLEQVQQGYPDSSRDEAPTWIASAALRSELLGEWPVAAPAPVEESGEIEEEDEEPEFVPAPGLDADPWTVAALPQAPEDEEPEPEPQPEPEPEPEPGRAAAPPVRPSAPVAATGTRLARYSLDPLADPAPKRRFSRRPGGEPVETVEVAARPQGARALPGVVGSP